MGLVLLMCWILVAGCDGGGPDRHGQGRDTTNPSIPDITPADGSTVDDCDLTLSGTASDASGVARVRVKVNDGAWQTAHGTNDWTVELVLADDESTIKIEAQDASASHNTTTVRMTITAHCDDRPTVTIAQPGDGATVDAAQVTVEGTASDDGAVADVSVRVNGGAWQSAPNINPQGIKATYEWSVTVDLDIGANTIEARAEDGDGNYSDIEEIEVTRPCSCDCDITAPNDGLVTNDQEVTVRGPASGDCERVEVRVNSGSWQAASGTASWNREVSLQHGQNTIEARAADAAGNWSAIASVTVQHPCEVRVSGHVVDFDTGTGVENVPVTVEETGQWTRTEADGSYECTVEVNATYAVSTSKREWFVMSAEEQTVDVRYSDTEISDFRMIARPLAGDKGRLSGFVVDTSRGEPQPVPGVDVAIDGIIVTADANGKYSSELPSDTYTVRPQSGGFTPGSQDLTVTAEETTSVGDFEQQREIIQPGLVLSVMKACAD